MLAFYPGDFTAVCTKQFCSYRDEGDQLDELGADVLGISPQSVDSHERLAKEKELNVPLLADEDKAVASPTASPLARADGAVHRAERHADGRYISGRSSSSTSRASSATARCRWSGLSFESVDDLEQALAAVG